MTTIRDDAEDIGWHDEFTVDIHYSIEERDKEDAPTHGAQISKRSIEHAIEGLLWSERTSEEERREIVGKAIEIIEKDNESQYNNEATIDFETWDHEPIETSKGTRRIEFDRFDNPKVEAELRTVDDAMKDSNCRGEYLTGILNSYISGNIDHDLWWEKPSEVSEILQRNGEEFLSEVVDLYVEQPQLSIGSNVYDEHVSVNEAETVEEYLDGLEKDYFQPI